MNIGALLGIGVTIVIATFGGVFANMRITDTKIDNAFTAQANANINFTSDVASLKTSVTDLKNAKLPERMAVVEQRVISISDDAKEILRELRK